MTPHDPVGVGQAAAPQGQDRELRTVRRRTGLRMLRITAMLAAALACAAIAPRWWCGREAPALLSDRLDGHHALASEVSRWAAGSAEQPGQFHTGSARYDGEWGYVGCMMAVLGLGQLATADPSLRAHYLPAMQACVGHMRSPAGHDFGTQAWGVDGLDTLDGNAGHAYLGYFNLALGMLRVHARDNSHAPLHDALTRTLLRRITASPAGLVETYPGEVYPADVCAVVGSIGLHARATGADHAAAVASWSTQLRSRYVDSASGLLIQSVDSRTWTPRDQPRASGTAVCAYMISFADPALSRDLYAALRSACAVDILGFGAVREYPPGAPGGWGDIDSGPVVFGLGLSASGFALASARMHGDGAFFTALWRSAYLFGAPVDRGGRRRCLTGGPLGNSILLAMTTARIEQGSGGSP